MDVFRRRELKFLVDQQQRQSLELLLQEKMVPDKHGRNTICNLYYDTPDYRLIRRSLERPVYKEKLRLRSYGTPAPDEEVFLEIKKKFKGVVYKRREIMTLREAMAYIEEGQKPCDSQIMREIDYAMHFYHQPQPMMLIAYEREAYFDADNPDLRITFDTNVRARDTDCRLEMGNHGDYLLPEDAIMMEIKTGGAMPVWLAQALSQCGIVPGRFSKYGTAYLRSAGLIPAPVYPRSTTRGDMIAHA